MAIGARALLIDLGNVLVAFDHGITLRALERATGIPAGRFQPVIFGELERSFDAGRLTPDAFFRAVEERAALPRLPDAIWVRAWRDIFKPIPEAIALLSRLAPGIRTALVSNTNSVHWEGVLRVADLSGHFDVLALSFQLGMLKPDPAIYVATLARLGVAAREAVFADDRAEHVEGARRVGIDAFVVDGPSSLETGLLSRGLLAE